MDHSTDQHGADTTDRGATELVLGALTGSVLLPFLQAFVTKAGEDVYQLVKGALSHRGRRAAKAELADSGTITLVDRTQRVVLRLPATVTDTMATRLQQAQLPIVRDGWFEVRWDSGRSVWVSGPCAEPPASHVELD